MKENVASVFVFSVLVVVLIWNQRVYGNTMFVFSITCVVGYYMYTIRNANHARRYENGVVVNENKQVQDIAKLRTYITRIEETYGGKHIETSESLHYKTFPEKFKYLHKFISIDENLRRHLSNVLVIKRTNELAVVNCFFLLEKFFELYSKAIGNKSNLKQTYDIMKDLHSEFHMLHDEMLITTSHVVMRADGVSVNDKVHTSMKALNNRMHDRLIVIKALIAEKIL